MLGIAFFITLSSTWYIIPSLCQYFNLADDKGNSYNLHYDPFNVDFLESEISTACSLLKIDGCLRLLRCFFIYGDLAECRESYQHTMPDALIANNLTGEVSLQQSFQHRFSSVSCQGGIQTLNGDLLRSSNHRHRFKPHDGEFKVCKFHNVCLLYGEYPTMIYFFDPTTEGELPRDQQFRYLSHFQQIELGYISDHDTRMKNRSWMPVTYVEEAIPANLFIHSSRIVPFLLESSYANHGHHLMDTVFPVFAAALQYNIPVANVLQLFVHSCSRMAGAVAGDTSSTIENVTHQMHCLALINRRWQFFFDQPPRFLDSMQHQKKKSCFRTLIAGMGSAFSQKAWDISRGPALRSFRDHVVKRTLSLDQQKATTKKWKNQVLVLQMGNALNIPGAGYKSKVNNDLCSTTSAVIEQINSHRKEKLEVVCYRPEVSSNLADLASSFASEVAMAQSSRLIVTYHGTLAYTALFAQDHTKVIAITEETAGNFAKDYHIFSRALHFSVQYLPLSSLTNSTLLLSLAKHMLNVQETEVEVERELHY